MIFYAVELDILVLYFPGGIQGYWPDGIDIEEQTLVYIGDL